jgi:hypothetical protein
LLRHSVVQSCNRNGTRTHAMVMVAPLLASVAIPIPCWFRPMMDEMLSTAFRNAQRQGDHECSGALSVWPHKNPVGSWLHEGLQWSRVGVSSNSCMT